MRVGAVVQADAEVGLGKRVLKRPSSYGDETEVGSRGVGSIVRLRDGGRVRVGSAGERDPSVVVH